MFSLANPSPSPPPPPPRPPLYMLCLYDVTTFHRPKGILAQNKLKDSNFIFPMTNIIYLWIFRTHGQEEYL